MPDNTYKDVDLSLVQSLLDDSIAWSVIESVTGCSRTTILRRMAESGVAYKKRAAGRPKAITDDIGRQVVAWSLEGVTNQEIADRLQVSASTVASYLKDRKPSKGDPAKQMCGKISIQDMLELLGAGITVAGIADVAEVNVTTVYYHIRKHSPGKEQLG